MSDRPLKYILYVEDSDDEVFLARMVFRRSKLETELVHYERYEMLETDLIAKGSIDLDQAILVMDLNLKVSNGNDALRRLRSLEATRDMVIGICTGSEDPADRRDAENAGADFFVSKPLNLKSLEMICDRVSSLSLVHSANGHYQLLKSA